MSDSRHNIVPETNDIYNRFLNITSDIVQSNYEDCSKDDTEEELNELGIDKNMKDEEIMYLKGVKKMQKEGLIDIGNLASWEVSSFKPGNDIDKLRDDSPFTFWQSDGQQPHNLIIKFTKNVNIEKINFFLNFQIDESYTPEKIKIFAGSSEFDLNEVIKIEFNQPVGWKNLNFKDISNFGFLKCYILKIQFLSNHQNGKDCHVRGIKIYSPSQNLSSVSNKYNDSSNVLADFEFTSMKLKRESVIR